MERTPNTLFDRLVERTLQSGPVIEAPLEPLFERFEDEVAEQQPSGPKRPAAARIAEAVAPGQPRAAVHVLAMDTEPTPNAPPRVETPVIEPRLMSRVVESAPVSIHRDPARPGAQETRIQKVRETRTVEPAAHPAEPQRAAATWTDAPHAVRTEHWMSEPAASSAASVVEPDLPPSIPQPPEQARSLPPQVSAEPTIHVTIGRLEIRTGDKEKPAGRRPRTTQGPSLEQYLTRRRGDAQ